MTSRAKRRETRAKEYRLRLFLEFRFSFRTKISRLSARASLARASTL